MEWGGYKNAAILEWTAEPRSSVLEPWNAAKMLNVVLLSALFGIANGKCFLILKRVVFKTNP